MISRRIEPSADLSEARERFLGDLRAWVADCIDRYADAPPIDVHDQATYTTAWEPYIAATREDVALAFLLRLRDRLRDHYVATGQWYHGYWRMQEAHHGTEHFELFLGMLARLAPDDPATSAQLLDAAEHLGNWVAEIEPWFDWERGLFRSTHFGTDGVGGAPGMALNIPDHLRCANICLLAHRSSGESRFLDLATRQAGKWAEAIVAGPALPLGLAADGPLYALSATEERHYRSFAGQALADPSLAAERAENFLASDAVNTFLALWRATGEARFRHAAERLLDALVTQLGDPDAGAVAAAIRDHRRATGDGRYDRAVLDAVAPLDPWAWDTLTLDLDYRPVAAGTGGAKRPAGIGKREDMLRWLEDGAPRRHSPLLLALAAELTEDRALAARSLDIARSYFAAARAALPDGRDHGCSSRSVSAVARGNGRENHAGTVTAVLAPIAARFFNAECGVRNAEWGTTGANHRGRLPAPSFRTPHSAFRIRPNERSHRTMTAPTAPIPPAVATARDQEFPILREVTYLNAASQGPLPGRTVRAIEEIAATAQFPHTARAQALPHPEPIVRERLARLIGANPGDFVFTSNTTHGMNICAQGIDWREGDNVVVPDHEFPSLASAWSHLRKRGVEVRFAPFAEAGPTVDEIMAHLDGRTRAVACSAITWNTGWRADLETLGARCAERGVLLIVDGIQAVGVRQIDVKAARISALATHGYKWLLAGFGQGALYVAPEAVDRINPTFIGEQAIASVDDAIEGRLDWKPGPARYVAGGLNRIGLAAYAASLGLLEEVGIDTIEERAHALGEMLYTGLKGRSGLRVVSSADPARRSQVIVFTLGDSERDAALVQQLEAQGIIVALRPMGVRVSPHFYNTEADVARLLDALPG